MRLGFFAHELRNLLNTALVAFDFVKSGNVGVAGSHRGLTNLPQNAFKFTRPHTTVSVRAGAGAERVLLEVEDECGGLPGGDLNDLFRPFDQRGANRTGLALGLALSRYGAEANRGVPWPNL
jgi:signal transduction histidine kinase